MGLNVGLILEAFGCDSQSDRLILKSLDLVVNAAFMMVVHTTDTPEWNQIHPEHRQPRAASFADFSIRIPEPMFLPLHDFAQCTEEA